MVGARCQSPGLSRSVPTARQAIVLNPSGARGNRLADLALRGIVDVDDAHQMAFDAACRLAKGVYKFEQV